MLAVRYLGIEVIQNNPTQSSFASWDIWNVRSFESQTWKVKGVDLFFGQVMEYQRIFVFYYMAKNMLFKPV